MQFYQFVLGMTGILSGLAVLITGSVLRYRAKERGLNKAASRQDLEEIRQHLTALGRDVHSVQETLADLTLMLNDSADRQLPPGDDSP